MRCYGTSQFVCTAYVAYSALNVLVLYRTIQLMYANSVCARLDPRAWGSYTYCTRLYGTFQFAYTSCGGCMASYVKILYTTVQGVYKNSVYTRPNPMACWTGMRVLRIVHLTFKVL